MRYHFTGFSDRKAEPRHPIFRVKPLSIGVLAMLIALAGCDRPASPPAPIAKPAPVVVKPKAEPPRDNGMTLRGTLSVETVLGNSLNADGSLRTSYLKRLKTTDGDYQFITSTDYEAWKSRGLSSVENLKNRIRDLKQQLDKKQAFLQQNILDKHSSDDAEIAMAVIKQEIDRKEKDLRDAEQALENDKKTTVSNAQVKTVLKQSVHSGGGVEWLSGKQYEIVGEPLALEHVLMKIDGVKAVILAKSVELLSDSAVAKPPQNAAWPPRSDEELDSSWIGKHLMKLGSPGHSYEFKSPTSQVFNGINWRDVPNEKSKDFPGTASGEILSSVAGHRYVATVEGVGMVYRDESKKQLAEIGPIVVSGELIVPWFFDDADRHDQFYDKEGKDKFVDNHFSARIIGNQFVVIRVERVNGDHLVLAATGGVGDSWCWPGTKMRVGNRTLERRKDGWYESGAKVSP